MVYAIYGTLLNELWKTVQVSTEVMVITSIEEENHLLLKGLALEGLECLPSAWQTASPKDRPEHSRRTFGLYHWSTVKMALVCEWLFYPFRRR